MTAYSAYARPPMARPARGRAPLALAITSMSLGIPLSAIALGVSSSGVGGLVALIVIWTAITAINLAYTLGGKAASTSAPLTGFPAKPGRRARSPACPEPGRLGPL